MSDRRRLLGMKIAWGMPARAEKPHTPSKRPIPRPPNLEHLRNLSGPAPSHTKSIRCEPASCTERHGCGKRKRDRSPKHPLVFSAGRVALGYCNLFIVQLQLHDVPKHKREDRSEKATAVG